MAVSSVAVAQEILREAFPGVRVSSKIPPRKNPPARYFRVDRVGGDRGRVIDHARILVECWNSDEVQAEQDCLDAYDALRMSPNGGPYADGYVSEWVGNTITHLDDPDVETHSRWQFSGTLRII
ncbi:hypothetical protein [Gordonia tangerina]|uniref:Tail terminator n=1 Tax=Gordonia tangerina TaxID=2911060 RepID=A0ABS9DQ26_9ACTN|nr:hypothetical protein [Gordonia tangerina]MCF3941322.1 hypothetical protein [Gordonia tangerina]